MVFLDVVVCPNMPRNWSKVVPEGNWPVPRQKEFGSDQPTLEDVYRVSGERFETQLKGVKSHIGKMDELWKNGRAFG